MPKKEDVEYLGMPLTGKLLMQLREVKEDRGIHNTTEIIRALIKEAHNKIRTTVPLKPSTIEKLDNQITQKKYSSRSELIEEAVIWFLGRKEKPR